MVTGFTDRQNSRIARVFFEAATRPSVDSEDILPQEGGPDEDYSVFFVFSQLFPEVVGAGGAGGMLTFILIFLYSVVAAMCP